MLVSLKLKDANIQKLIKQLVVLIDTREQKNEHIIQALEKKKIPYRVKALKFCDYSAELDANPDLGIPFNISLENVIAIERKGSGGNGLSEISHNFGADRTTFENEFIRAKESGADIHLIIENGSYEDIREHKYRGDISENALYNSLLSWQKKYNLKISFIKSENVCDHILRVLAMTLKKMLEE